MWFQGTGFKAGPPDSMEELSPRLLALAHTLVSPLLPQFVCRALSTWDVPSWHLIGVPVPAAALTGYPPRC